MNIYFGKNKKTSVKITLAQLLEHNLSKNNFKMDSCSEEQFGNVTVGVDLEAEGKVIGVSMEFENNDENNIKRISVYSTPIVTAPDYDRQKRLTI